MLYVVGFRCWLLTVNVCVCVCVLESESVYCQINRNVCVCVCGCVLVPSPGAGGAVCLWHLWSTDSVQVPPLCRYNAHLHPELSCTPATPPLAGWSAYRNTGTVVNAQPTHIQRDTLNKSNTDDIALMKLRRTAVMFFYFLLRGHPFFCLMAPQRFDANQFH